MKIRNGFVSNSSSSCFVCNSKHTKEQTEKILKDLITVYNKIYNYEFYNKDMIRFKDIMYLFYSDKKHSNELIQDWGNFEDTTGKLIIQSREDNSIPCDMFDDIINIFEAYRIHQG